MIDVSGKEKNIQNKEIQVFLATYNRAHLIEKVINSILEQSFNSFELIISDNSTNDDTQVLINKLFCNELKYIRRQPPVGPIEHLNLILQDVTSKYFMIFHDDDIMHFNMLETLYNKISKRKEIIAIGANARIIENGTYTIKKFYPNLKSDLVITTRDQIVHKYLTEKIVPFPSYIYRIEVAKRLRFNPENGGNHCDAAFIMDLITLGFIIFSAEPLMDYNRGTGENRKRYQNHFIDFIKLLNYISKTSKYSKRNPIILRERMLNVYAELKDDLLKNKVKIGSKKYFSHLTVIFKISPFEYFIKIILITFYIKVKQICKIILYNVLQS